MTVLLENGSALIAAYQMHDFHGGSGSWVVMMGFMVLGVVAILAVVLAVLRHPGRGKAGESDEPLIIAQRRLASGEISVDEYQRLRNALERSDVGSDS